MGSTAGTRPAGQPGNENGAAGPREGSGLTIGSTQTTRDHENAPQGGHRLRRDELGGEIRRLKCHVLPALRAGAGDSTAVVREESLRAISQRGSPRVRPD